MNNFNKMIEGNQLMVILIFIYFFFYITTNAIYSKIYKFLRYANFSMKLFSFFFCLGVVYLENYAYLCGRFNNN